MLPFDIPCVLLTADIPYIGTVDMKRFRGLRLVAVDPGKSEPMFCVSLKPGRELPAYAVLQAKTNKRKARQPWLRHRCHHHHYPQHYALTIMCTLRPMLPLTWPRCELAVFVVRHGTLESSRVPARQRGLSG